MCVLNSICTCALRSIFPFTRCWDFYFDPVVLQSFRLFTCPSGHPYCPTSVLICMLGSILPSTCTVFPHNALCRVWYATILNRYSLRYTNPWILISHKRRTDLTLLGRRAVTTKRGNRIWISCLLCTNLQICLITKISVHKNIVLKLSLFVVLFLYVSSCVCLSSGWAVRTAQCLRMALSNCSLPEDGSNAGFRNFEIYLKIRRWTNSKIRKCYQWVTTRLYIFYLTACGVTLQPQRYVFKI
jgi:hypothetical protein